MSCYLSYEHFPIQNHDIFKLTLTVRYPVVRFCGFCSESLEVTSTVFIAHTILHVTCWMNSHWSVLKANTTSTSI